MRWCRIHLVLFGLLGFLCVVHVVSGTCGQRFSDLASSSYYSEVVLEGKVRVVPKPRPKGEFNITIAVRKIYKGANVLSKSGKTVRKINIGPFSSKKNPEECIGSAKVGANYLFFLKKEEGARKVKGLFFSLVAMPEKKNRKREKLLRKALCKKCVKPPKIRKFTSHKNVSLLNSKVTLKCLVTKSAFEPVFTWYKDGVLLKSKKGIIIKSDRRKSRLRIRSASAEDAGNYTCKVANAVGSTNKTIQLQTTKKEPSGHDEPCENQTLCLHGGRCMRVLDTSYCQCPEKWSGRRCEVLGGLSVRFGYNRQATLLYERTLIIVGIVIAVLVFIVICIASYFLAKRKRKDFEKRRQLREARRSAAQQNSQNSAPLIPEPVRTASKYTAIEPDFHDFTQGHHNPVGNPGPTHHSGAGADNTFMLCDLQGAPAYHSPDQYTPIGKDPVDRSRKRLQASSVYENVEDQNTPNGVSRSIAVSNSPNGPESNIIMEPEQHGIPSTVPHQQQKQQQKSHHPPPPYPSHTSFSPSPPPIYPDYVDQTSPTTDNDKGPLLGDAAQSQPLMQSPSFDEHRPPSEPFKPSPEVSLPSSLGNDSDSDNNDDERNRLLGRQPPPILPPSHRGRPRQEPPQANGILQGGDSEGEYDEKVHPGGNSDLHISEDDLALSKENLNSSSFGSLDFPYRQGSHEDSTPCFPYTSKRPDMRKQQSEEAPSLYSSKKNALLESDPHWSHSLDNPSETGALKGENRGNRLNSTLAGTPDDHFKPMAPYPNHNDYNAYDPIEDPTPWEKDTTTKPESSMNLSPTRQDRLNRLKDVLPDQSAIHI